MARRYPLVAPAIISACLPRGQDRPESDERETNRGPRIRVAVKVCHGFTGIPTESAGSGGGEVQLLKAPYTRMLQMNTITPYRDNVHMKILAI